MKQALLSLIRPLRPAATLRSPAMGMRELDQAALRLVAGGAGQGQGESTQSTESPRTGW
jgi:hypothetical protein